MAKVHTEYSCGCGFKTQGESKAIAHTDTSGHAMTVQGTIAPDNLRKTAGPRRHAAVLEKPRGHVPPKAYDDLRRKLQGG